MPAETRLAPDGGRDVGARATPDDAAATDWRAAYLLARSREGRLYPDAVVAQLPDVPASHPLRQEWRQRADSSRRLVRYLRGRSGPLRVLDLGCGNGWLAHLLAGIPGSDVTGIDTNEVELDQAARVFVAPNLRFIWADISRMAAPPDRPDVVVMASAIQYVPDLASLVRRLRSWLPADGEVHLLDSPLYRPDELDGARERTRRHYADIGVPEMAAAYHHHVWQDLDPFPYRVLYRPDAFLPRAARRGFGRPRSPFPWIRIAAGDGPD